MTENSESSFGERTHLDDLLNEKLESAFSKSTAQFVVHDLAKIAAEHDAIDLAFAVTRLPLAARSVVFENLPDQKAKESFLIHTGHSTRNAVFRTLSNEEIAHLIEPMPSDEAVSVLDDLSQRRMRRISELLTIETRARITELQQHGYQTAGRLMTNEFFSFHLNDTIADVTKTIRDNPGIDFSRSVFLVDDSGQLVGYVPARTLLVNSHETSLRQVMRSVVHTVGPEATRDEVVDVVERYKVGTLPVVDGNQHLLGVIAYEDVVEMMEDIADETIASLAGTAEDIAEHEPLMVRFFYRAPWLLVMACSGLITATGLSHFYDRFWYFAVPAFVPLITGVSGAVGIVSSTILVRSMATGEVTASTRMSAALKELALGTLAGAFFGLLSGLIVYFFDHLGIYRIEGVSPMVVGTIVGTGIFCACLLSTTLGSFSPLLFAQLKIDPAVASGPIVTACNDVLSTVMYMFVAYFLSAYIFGLG